MNDVTPKFRPVHDCIDSQGTSSDRRLRIIIPAHNEERRIEPTVRDFCAHFGDRAVIVVVANACSDGSVRILRRLCAEFANLELLVIAAPIGKGGAVRAGFKLGDEPYVGFTDADHSTSAAEFDRLFGICAQRELCGVIGSRWKRGAKIERKQPTQRLIASRVFNAFVRVLFGLPFADTQCGAKVFRRSAIAGAITSLELADFAFDIDLLTNVRGRGCAVEEVATVWSDSLTGTSVTQLGRTSAIMLWGLVRLRIRRSIFATFPYIAWLAHNSVIPARDHLSLLVLADNRRLETSAEGRYLAGAVRRWTGQGHRVKFVRPANALQCLGFPFWYVLRSRRLYDAIVELRGPVPFFVTSFSSKPTYVVEGCGGETPNERRRSWLERALYGRSRSIVVADDRDAPSASASLFPRPNGSSAIIALSDFDDLLGHVRLDGAYRASFDQYEGAWHLTFRDPHSNELVRQAILPERALA